MNASQQLADFVAHAPIQAWCGAFLFLSVCVAAVVCLTVGGYLELTKDSRRRRGFARRMARRPARIGRR